MRGLLQRLGIDGWPSDYSQRMVGAHCLLLATIGFALAVYYWCDRVFYCAAKGTLTDAWRLLWMAPFSAAGLTWRAYKWRYYGLGKRPPKGRRSPLFKYWLLYPAGIAAGDVLMFAAMHTFLGLDNWHYYLVAPIVALTLGRAPGLWRRLMSQIGLKAPD